MAHDLKPYENITRVFWIKIELKESQRLGRQAFGEIKDVMSGAKSPINNCLDILGFMYPYMEQMGIGISLLWRLAIWMKRKINSFRNKT